MCRTSSTSIASCKNTDLKVVILCGVGLRPFGGERASCLFMLASLFSLRRCPVISIWIFSNRQRGGKVSHINLIDIMQVP